MISTEDILFVMPRDRELQFPAMAALQRYVNDYKIKMEANCVIPKVPDYRCRYKVDIPEEDWNLFRRLGIELKQEPEEIGYPDSVIELTDQKIMSMYDSAKHAFQVCGAISGVECRPYPKMKQMECGRWSNWLLVFGRLYGITADYMPPGVYITSVMLEELIHWQQREGTSVLTPILVGSQSQETYAAAALGLPVIEILPKNRSANWLSKFVNPLYRLIEEENLERLPDALSSIEAVMKFLAEQKCRYSQAQADKEQEIPTAPSA